jgi:hypothetical protein
VSGSINIVANHRLNSLIVEANAKDLDLVEQLLHVIDQKKSPEPVQTWPAPRLIPVYHTNAQDIESVVRAVYSDRVSGAGNQPQQPRPEDIIRALRGGRGRQDSDEDSAEAKPTISLGVDQKNNALIVAAPDPTFDEIKTLVHELDRIDSRSSESTRVITLKKVNPELIRRALATIVGRPEPTAPPASPGPPGQRDGEDRSGNRPPMEGRQAQFRQNAEFFRAIQEQRERQEQQNNRRGRDQRRDRDRSDR